MRKKCPSYPDDRSYRDLVKNYFINNLRVNSNLKRQNVKKYNELMNIKENWLMLVDRRNALAHVVEDYDSDKGYYIQSNNEKCEEKFTIYESNLDKERCDLLEVVKMEISFLYNILPWLGIFFRRQVRHDNCKLSLVLKVQHTVFFSAI